MVKKLKSTKRFNKKRYVLYSSETWKGAKRVKKQLQRKGYLVRITHFWGRYDIWIRKK